MAVDDLERLADEYGERLSNMLVELLRELRRRGLRKMDVAETLVGMVIDMEWDRPRPVPDKLLDVLKSLLYTYPFDLRGLREEWDFDIAGVKIHYSIVA